MLREAGIQSHKALMIVTLLWAPNAIPISVLPAQVDSMPRQASASDSASPSSGKCAVAELKAEWLRVNGQVVYIEPLMAESNSLGDVFLAGRFNLVGVVDSSNHWKPTLRHDAVVGAILPKSGSPRLVGSPFPGRRLGGFQSLPVGDSSWLVVFGERIRGADGTYADSARSLWAGHYDGWRWSGLTRLPTPPGRAYALSDASRLVTRGDTVWWSIRKAAPPGVVVMEGVQGKWTFTRIDEFLHSPMLALAPAIQMYVVGPDQTLPADGNSLWTWTRQPQWRLLRKEIPSQREEVQRPSLMVLGGQAVSSWVSPAEGNGAGGFQLRAMIQESPLAALRLFTVDSAMSGLPPFLPLAMTNEQPLWISDHARGSNGGQIQFSTYDATSGGLHVLGRFSHDYITPFVAVSRGGGDFLVSGAHYEVDRYAVSLLRTFRVSCTGGSN